MKYIVCQKFNSKALCGIVSLRKGTTCNEINGFLYHNNDVLCAKTSANAYNYFARNDDGQGYERFGIAHEVLDIIKGYVIEYNEEFARIAGSKELSDEEKKEAISTLPNKVLLAYDAIEKAHPELVHDQVFTFEFYNADVSVLEEVKQLCLSLSSAD